MQNPLLRTVVGLAMLGGLVGTAACGRPGPAGDPNKVNTVAAFYPLQFVTQHVGGDEVTVTTLAKPGAEPHDLELSPQQVAQIADARLVVYLKGFQPAVDEGVAQQAGDRAFDAAAVEPLIGGAGDTPGREESTVKDPHIWLDPVRLATVGDRLADRLAQLDPAHATDYRSRAATLRVELEKLDAEYRHGLRNCARKEIVTSHAAFGYLARRYGLRQIPITGLSPEEEPSPQRLADVAATAAEHGATTIFFETLVSPKVAETLANEVGAKTAVLDPIEGLEPGSTGDYFSVMRDNLATLKPALGCP
jgi:zinc transport system substrate-binding protein